MIREDDQARLVDVIRIWNDRSVDLVPKESYRIEWLDLGPRIEALDHPYLLQEKL